MGHFHSFVYLKFSGFIGGLIGICLFFYPSL